MSFRITVRFDEDQKPLFFVFCGNKSRTCLSSDHLALNISVGDTFCHLPLSIFENQKLKWTKWQKMAYPTPKFVI